MSHKRKKGGDRKDKKTARMREDLAERKERAEPERPSTDQPDIQEFKPGAADDKSRSQTPP